MSRTTLDPTLGIHTLTAHELAARCGVTHDFVERLVEIGILEGHISEGYTLEEHIREEHIREEHIREEHIREEQGGAPARFAGELTLRVHRCLRLQHDLGLNLEGVALVLELLDRIELLEHQLLGLRPR